MSETKSKIIQENQSHSKWLNKNIMIYESCHYTYQYKTPVSHLHCNFVWGNYSTIKMTEKVALIKICESQVNQPSVVFSTQICLLKGETWKTLFLENKKLLIVPNSLIEVLPRQGLSICQMTVFIKLNCFSLTPFSWSYSYLHYLTLKDWIPL